MSEESDALAKAVTLQMRLAASCQRRREEAEAEVGRLSAEREAAVGQEALRAALAEQIGALRAEAVEAEAAKQAALAEVAQLRKLVGRLPAIEARALAAQVRALAGGDDVSDLDEGGPLDAARAHIRDLDAQARLGERSTGGMSEEEARAELAALRAARGTVTRSLGDDPRPATDEAAPANDDPPRGPTKRTL